MHVNECKWIHARAHTLVHFWNNFSGGDVDLDLYSSLRLTTVLSTNPTVFWESYFIPCSFHLVSLLALVQIKTFGCCTESCFVLYFQVWVRPAQQHGSWSLRPGCRWLVRSIWRAFWCLCWRISVWSVCPLTSLTLRSCTPTTREEVALKESRRKRRLDKKKSWRM